ncbi:MAG: hypothetical protein D6773_09855 [Alphaproteobacteria bacterium]|nr:MAG: hypothetical protein D6773_09855 [Alphaproteobacteria bacterium]
MSSQADIDALFDDAPAAQDAMDAASPVNSETGLATDFMNQYNEITMILDMLGDMPELFEDIANWKPKTYAEHFEASQFQDKDKIVAAYDNAPEEYRGLFDGCTMRLNALLLKGVMILGNMIEQGETDTLPGAVALISGPATQLMDNMNGIIHGSTEVADQSEIDALIDGDLVARYGT